MAANRNDATCGTPPASAHAGEPGVSPELAHLLDTFPGFWWTAGPDGAMRYFNRTCVEYTGEPLERLQGAGWVEQLHPADRPVAIEQWNRSITEGRPFDVEVRIRGADGAYRWFLVQATASHDARGRIESWYGHGTDITEHKQTEQALRESERRFRTTFENAAVGIAHVGPNGRFLRVNDQLCRITGYPREELIARTFQEITHPDDLAADLVQTRRLWRGEIDHYSMERRYFRKDGTIVWVLLTGSVHRDATGRVTHVIAIVDDISECKAAEEALRHSEERLEEQVRTRTAELEHRNRQLQKLALELSDAEERQRKRVANILHEDLQQMLAGARFHLELLDERAESNDVLQEIAQEVKQVLREAIGKARQLSQELDPVLFRIDLRDMLHWLAEQMERKHGLQVRLELRGSFDAVSEPVKAFLHKTAQEVLFNVVRHAGVDEAQLRMRHVGRCVRLTVSDRGRGFDRAVLRDTSGAGLFGIRERAELLGGRMAIRSAPGRGSAVSVALPDEPYSDR